MPLFGTHREPTPPPQPEPQSGGFFSRNKQTTPPSFATNDAPARHGSLFSRRRSHSSERTSPTNNDANSSRSGGGFFSLRRSSSGEFSGHTISHDPSIVAARGKVSDAEAAEHQADQALNAARKAVREARDHVRILEREALEE